MLPSFLAYWPTRDRVNECIRHEAETITEPVFLAVHQPVEFLKRSCETPQESQRVTEQQFLEAFLTSDLPSGTLLVPILGSSGVGKSHMIRWLDAQLRRQSDPTKRHIIRIPKSASLRQVLNLILENLHGGGYEEIRVTLGSAGDNIDPLHAREHLRASLLVALERASTAAIERIKMARQNGLNPAPEDRMRQAHASTKALQALLSDPEFHDHFMGGDDGKKGILSQIAQRAVNGGAVDPDLLNQFSQHDLTVTDELCFRRPSETAVVYCKQLETSAFKQEAVTVLNEVLDQAVYHNCPVYSPMITGRY